MLVSCEPQPDTFLLCMQGSEDGEEGRGAQEVRVFGVEWAMGPVEKERTWMGKGRASKRTVPLWVRRL